MSSYDLLTVPPWAALGGYELGTGRTVPTVAAVVGLISVIVAGRALIGRAAAARRAGAIALVLGSISAIVGGVHALNAAGGLGTGNGLAGAVAAVALGLTGMILAGATLARGRRHARSGRAA